MEYVVHNSGLTTRKEHLNGRDYLVAPASMLVPGILPGSQGALYYPKEEVIKNTRLWNGMPLTLGHPTDNNGNAVSARNPAILDKFSLGQVFNVTGVNGKLDGEAWFDVDRTSMLAPSLLRKLELQEPFELSTGLFVKTKSVRNGVFKGKRYDGIASNYEPDHLAVLLGQKGACGLNDGCGVLVNKAKGRVVITDCPLKRTVYMVYDSPCPVTNTTSLSSGKCKCGGSCDDCKKKKKKPVINNCRSKRKRIK